MPRRAEPALVYSAAAIFAAAGVVGAIESLLPEGPEFSPAAGLSALAIAALLTLFGRRLPRWVVYAFGPVGAALVALAVATTRGYSDAAIIYCWPVIWVASFYGTRATVAIVAWVGIVHGVALAAMPDGMASADRWADVVVSVSVVAVVVRVLAARNERLVAQLSTEARVDPLTGLWNRRAFGERLDTESARAVREGTSLAVVMFDIDHFKRINDVHGHDVGDRVLKWVAETLMRETRGADITARVGGEEFLVVLPGTGVEGACEFAERVRAAIAGGGGPVELTISAGVAAGTVKTAEHGLVDAADRALYAAKRGGRNAVRVTPVEVGRSFSAPP
ncbi:GGDEF domain-containing protein [Solirubrobacter sp. CPCC 204708]|uniref:GGDEF domain-containing protein n=1 Tax=Solirubrobacter deserti TaxID=2282478 RepID=A0ABT4RDS0_9ACTN|nr:GGDEF domain-containing protein [Solirubrobacter deserti]MBE2314676.1 GGDEF domain-containing protein [Solirubrobacter deserti]MDA0136684.1 GGDEF domain-containing protein [Solirubrobacter deserti]